MDEEFKELVRKKKQIDDNRSHNIKRESKDRLEKNIITKITTTMIGALQIIENEFSFLWEPEVNGRMSTEALSMLDMYKEVRRKILDNGNNQIHAIKNELKQYDVEWLRYHVDLKVLKSGEENE